MSASLKSTAGPGSFALMHSVCTIGPSSKHESACNCFVQCVSSQSYAIAVSNS